MSDPDHPPDLPLHNLTAWWEVQLSLALLFCSAPGSPSLMNQLLLTVLWQLTWLSLEIWVCYRFVSSRSSPWLWVLNILISQGRTVRKINIHMWDIEHPYSWSKMEYFIFHKLRKCQFKYALQNSSWLDLFCSSSWWKGKEDDIKIILIVKDDEGLCQRQTFEVDVFQDVYF